MIRSDTGTIPNILSSGVCYELELEVENSEKNIAAANRSTTGVSIVKRNGQAAFDAIKMSLEFLIVQNLSSAIIFRVPTMKTVRKIMVTSDELSGCSTKVST